jgi:hypothetical protein
MSTLAPGGEIRELSKVASITPMGPKQRYNGPDRREHERREHEHAAKPVTRIQSFLQSVITVGAVIAVGLSIHQSGKTDENRLTKLETNASRHEETVEKFVLALEEITKTNKALVEQKKADIEDWIMILEQSLRYERDAERRQDLREALKRAKAKRLQGQARPKPDTARLGMLRGVMR